MSETRVGGQEKPKEPLVRKKWFARKRKNKTSLTRAWEIGEASRSAERRRDAEAEEMTHDVCTREDLRIMFWNAQGLATELLDLGKLMETEEADIVGVMETCMLAREDLSQGKTKWFPGPDPVFHPVSGRLERGMGAFVNMKRLPGANVAWKGIYSFCVWVPGSPGQKPLAVYISHIPGWTEQRRRKEAMKELEQAMNRTKQTCRNVLGGDLNSRAAMNGDGKLKMCGKQLLEFCVEAGLVMANAMECSEGTFSREQLVRRRGCEVIDKTTVDYACVDARMGGDVKSFRILDKGELSSDHKPVLLTLRWAQSQSEPMRTPLKLRYKVHNRAEKLSGSFEETCEPLMVSILARGPADAGLSSQQDIDRSAQDLTTALQLAAKTHFGIKLVGGASKAWFDSDVRSLFKVKERAAHIARALDGGPRQPEAMDPHSNQEDTPKKFAIIT